MCSFQVYAYTPPPTTGLPCGCILARNIANLSSPSRANVSATVSAAPRIQYVSPSNRSEAVVARFQIIEIDNQQRCRVNFAQSAEQAMTGCTTTRSWPSVRGTIHNQDRTATAKLKYRRQADSKSLNISVFTKTRPPALLAQEGTPSYKRTDGPGQRCR